MNDNENYLYYGDFDWKNFVSNHPILKNVISNKEQIYKYLINEESKTNYYIYFKIDKSNTDMNFYSHNDLNISYEKFEWKPYILINLELKKKGINTKEKAWLHWINNGKTEERAFSLINNSNIHNGRFGNLFFINMFLHFMSIKYNLKCSYKNNNKFKLLGIFYNIGQNIYNKNLLVTEQNMMTLLQENHDKEPCNLIINNNVWFQSKEFCLIIQKYFYKEINKNSIINNNYYKNRYNNNKDLFIHIRMGDVANITGEYLSYYEKILNIETYDNAYISSDSIEHDLCKKLIQKYKLIVFNKSDIETIMFSSTCNKIILSGGTFSWMIGFFAFFAESIYYPEVKNKWYGDIFSFSNWLCIP
jgi:hypothetical protein